MLPCQQPLVTRLPFSIRPCPPGEPRWAETGEGVKSMKIVMTPHVTAPSYMTMKNA